uniref:Cationic amino acid transporter C-terminal domain-containing protein n=1 Tax=Pseudo-nitzschia australis TaxID=44445 RepID=A0A7S4AMR6_9STRA
MISRQLFDAMHRKKSLSEARYNSGDGDNDTTSGLRKSLNAVDLILYGLGSAVGAGIYILAGIGAKLAGPAISLSFLGCGLSCTLTALAYAEFSSLIPASGSAYIYTYVAFGEVYAFCVGWNLILGYGFTASVAARAWADYIGDFMVKMTGADWIIPYCTEVPLFSSIWTDYTCSPLSVVIVLVSTIVLLRGTKDSSTFNNLICVTNLSILALIVVSALVSGSVEATDNLTPFAPSGMPGILRGAGLVFYAFIGFDMVASLSEEVIHPEKNMPIGIVGSLLLSTLIYCGVTLVVVGMTPLPFLGETTPLVNAILANACCSHSEQMEVVHAGEEAEVCLKDCPAFEKPVLAFVSRVVSGGAGFGLMAACFTSLMGQPRIFYRMALDGLWFPLFARVDPETQTMSEGILMTGFVAAVIACFVPLEALANLISLGTLMVFTFVDAGVILLRLGNVSEKILKDRLNSGNTRTEEEEAASSSTIKNHQKRVIQLLVVFTISVLGISFILSNTLGLPSSRIPLLFLTAVALICGMLICYTPDSWTEKHQSITVSPHFECPCFPIIPVRSNIRINQTNDIEPIMICFTLLHFFNFLYLNFIYCFPLEIISRETAFGAFLFFPNFTIVQIAMSV